MQRALLFIAVSACSGAGPGAPPPPVAWPQQRDGVAVPEPPLPAPAARGEACAPTRNCAAGLTCLATPGGTCASRCGLFGSPCDDGACVTTVRAGELCLTKCEADADCRSDEGYFCDPQWKACAIPNTLAMVPRTCPGSAARDPAFGATVMLTGASTPGAYQQEPSAALETTGALLVAALDVAALDAPPRVITTSTARHDAGGRGELPMVRGPYAGVSLARDRKGVLYAAWSEPWSGGPAVFVARSRDDGHTWTTPIRANAPAECAGEEMCIAQQQFVVGPDPADLRRDVLYAVYVVDGAVRASVSYDEGTSFRAPVTALSAIRASATVDAAGRLHLIGVQGGPTTGAYGSASHAIVYATSMDAGRTFTRPAQLHKRDERLPFYGAVPQLVVDTKRKWLYAVYVRGGRDAVWDLAVLASKDNGATWKRTRIGDDCALHTVPRAALDPTTGTLHLAWYDSRGATGRFAHATCTPGLTKCTPALAINDRAFAALSTARRSPAAIGDHAALVIDDKRRVLHAVWTQPLDEAGTIKARIFHATARLPKR